MTLIKYWIVVKNGDKLFEAVEEHPDFVTALRSAKRRITNRDNYSLAVSQEDHNVNKEDKDTPKKSKKK